MSELKGAGGVRDGPPSASGRNIGVEKLLLSVLDGSSDAIIVLDGHANIAYVNRRFIDLFPHMEGLAKPGSSYETLLRTVIGDTATSQDGVDEGAIVDDWLNRLRTEGLDNEIIGGDGERYRIRSERIFAGNIAVYHQRSESLPESRAQGSIDNIDHLRDVVDFMDQGILTTRPDDHFEFSNSRCAEILEIPPELVAPGASRMAMVEYRTDRGDYRQNGYTNYEQVMEDFAPGRKSSMEIATPSGRIVRTDANTLPNGGSVFTYTDITSLRHHTIAVERHRRHLEQREQELNKLASKLNRAGHDNWALLSRFEAIIDNIDYAVVFMDSELRVEIANRAWKEMWGFDAGASLVGRTMADLINTNRYNDIYDVPDSQWEDFVGQHTEAVRRGFEGPTEIHRKDGKILRYQCVALADGSRMLTYFDITDIKNREIELKRNSEALQVIFNNIGQGITWFDANLNVRALNAKALEVLDVPADEFGVGDSLESLIRKNVERGEYGAGEVDAIVAERLSLVRTSEPQAVERDRYDGRRIRIERYPVSEGGFVAVYTDITIRHEQQQALEEEKERANRANQAKSAFLANMSHEIRTPLNSILGLAELLQTTDVDSRQRRFAETIVSSGRGLLSILNDILDFSKIEAGELSIELEPFDLRTIVEGVATMLSSQTANKNVDILVRFKPGVPRHLISDEGRLRQVLTNLVGNAVKFTDAGHVLIDVTGQRDGDNLELMIAVVDTGTGIAPDQHEAIFGAFQQVDGSSTRRHGGTGLGLAISKRLIESLGGRIGIDSELGRGSTFWIKARFPIASEGGNTVNVADSDLAGRSVLVVDGRPVNRLILEEQLHNWGAEAICVDTGVSALDAIKRAIADGNGFPVAITDDKLPDMDAETFVKHCRAIEGADGLPIIALTSIGKTESWNRLRGLELAGLVEKPVRTDSLLLAILDALAGSAIEPAGEVSEAVPAPADDSDPGPGSAPPAPERRQILVAEDHELNRRLIEHMLYGTGFDPVFAEDGAIAVKLYGEIKPELVLMDVSMPKMDGFEATAHIRKLQEADGVFVPIVGVTAHAFEEDRRRCLKSGMDDHLPKPLSLDALKATLERWAGKSAQHGAATAG